MTEDISGAPAAPRPDPVSIRCGVVLFDDEKDPRAGWIAVNGSKARRISGINELPTGTIWLSNMSYESFFRSTDTWRNPWIRHESYLVVKIKDMLLEWGYDPANSPADFTANFCSILFHRIMTIAARLLREQEPTLRMNNAFMGTTLREDLRRLLPKADYPKGEAAALLRSGQAFAEFTSTTVRGQRGARQVVLRAPRMAYAADMLTAPVPKGGFDFISRGQLRERPDVGRDRVSWVQSCDKPLFIEVQVDQMDPDVSAVYGFGNATDRDKRVPRSWVAHPEFLTMSAFSEMDVKNVYMGIEYGVIGNELGEPLKRFLTDRFSETSWSAGVVAETLWRAAALGEDRSTVGKKTPPEERPHTSWRGVWVKAADKCAMFMSAMKLARMGYDISSYGLGWVIVRVADEAVGDLIRDGLTIGLIPRFADVPDNLYKANADIPWQGDKKAKSTARFTMTKERNLLWNLDKLVLFEKEQQEGMLRKMLLAMKTGAAG